MKIFLHIVLLVINKMLDDIGVFQYLLMLHISHFHFSG